MTGTGKRANKIKDSHMMPHSDNRGRISGEGSCGNDGAVETVESRRQAFHPFPPPLGNLANPRDYHIPTARAAHGGKGGKPKAGFPLLPRAACEYDSCCVLPNQTRTRGSGPAASGWSRAKIQRRSPSFRRQKGHQRFPPVSGSLFDWKMLTDSMNNTFQTRSQAIRDGLATLTRDGVDSPRTIRRAS